jgi:hypothetical protein
MPQQSMLLLLLQHWSHCHMKGSDRILILIVGAVVLLVIGAVVAVVLRPEPEYTTGSTPEDVVHNYLLALQQGDYERAYGCLHTEVKVKDLDDFIDSVESRSYAFDLGSNVALSIDEESHVSESSARVTVHKTETYNDLFGGSSYERDFNVRLMKENNQWKINDSGDYWDYCWDKTSTCR